MIELTQKIKDALSRGATYINVGAEAADLAVITGHSYVNTIDGVRALIIHADKKIADLTNEASKDTVDDMIAAVKWKKIKRRTKWLERGMMDGDSYAPHVENAKKLARLLNINKVTHLRNRDDLVKLVKIARRVIKDHKKEQKKSAKLMDATTQNTQNTQITHATQNASVCPEEQKRLRAALKTHVENIYKYIRVENNILNHFGINVELRAIYAILEFLDIEYTKFDEQSTFEEKVGTTIGETEVYLSAYAAYAD